MKRGTLRNSPVVKVQMRVSTRYMMVGCTLIIVLLSLGLFVFLNLGNNQIAKASGPCSVIVNNGNWSSPATWSCGLVPADNSVVTISTGFTVNFDNNITYQNLTINISGTLNFTTGNNFNLDNVSVINVFSGGRISGGGISSLIRIGSAAYSGPYAITGPVALNATGLYQPLPITLLSFTAKANNGQVELNWTTVKEENNDHFTVERSRDAKNFEAILKVKGAGTTNERRAYSTADDAPLTGTTYYRLRQTDYNGENTVSKMVAVAHDGDQDLDGNSSLTIKTVGPNPFKQDFFIDFDLANGGPVSLKLSDMQGKVFESQITDGIAGTNRYEFNNGHELKPGIYLFSLRQMNTNKVVRLVKL